MSDSTPFDKLPKIIRDGLSSLQVELEATSRRSLKHEEGLATLARQVNQAGCAVAAVVEGLHEGNFHRSNYDDLLVKVIEEVGSQAEPRPLGRLGSDGRAGGRLVSEPLVAMP